MDGQKYSDRIGFVCFCDVDDVYDVSVDSDREAAGVK